MRRCPPIGRSRSNGGSRSTAGRRLCCGGAVRDPSIRSPPPRSISYPDVQSAFPILRGSQRAWSERAASCVALRGRSARRRRGLDGFIVLRADRYQNEYVPPQAERLAWLTGFYRFLGRARHRIFRPRRHLRRWPLSRAGTRRGRCVGLQSGASDRTSAGHGSRRICRPARSSLIRRGRIRWTAPSYWPKPCEAGVGRPSSPWPTTRSTPRLARSAGGAARRGRAARSALCRRRGRGKTFSVRADMQKTTRPMHSSSPDPQSVVVALQHSRNDVRTRRSCLPPPLCREGRAARALRRRPKARQRCPAPPRRPGRCARPERFRTRLGRTRQGTARRAARSRRLPEAIARLVISTTAAKVPRGGDPDYADEGGQERAEIAGAKAAQLRDGSAVTRFLAWFDGEAPRGAYRRRSTRSRRWRVFAATPAR